MTPFQKHIAEWKNCQRCELCYTRKNVVLLRGFLPCDVMFIGEAPGDSEDVHAQPFYGPAGQRLDRIVEMAGVAEAGLKTAFTNLTGCVPKDEEGAKDGAPSTDSVEACAPRLVEIVRLCHPRLMVAVGDLAAYWLPKLLAKETFPVDDPQHFVKIMHPAAIMRADISMQGLLTQRAVVTISDAISEI